MNFDYWKQLYIDNPVMAERIRNRVVQLTILNRPQEKQWKLYQLHKNIKNINNIRCKSPLRSCILITNMMMESVNELNGMYKLKGFGVK